MSSCISARRGTPPPACGAARAIASRSARSRPVGPSRAGAGRRNGGWRPGRGATSARRGIRRPGARGDRATGDRGTGGGVTADVVLHHAADGASGPGLADTRVVADARPPAARRSRRPGQSPIGPRRCDQDRATASPVARRLGPVRCRPRGRRRPARRAGGRTRRPTRAGHGAAAREPCAFISSLSPTRV